MPFGNPPISLRVAMSGSAVLSFDVTFDEFARTLGLGVRAALVAAYGFGDTTPTRGLWAVAHGSPRSWCRRGDLNHKPPRR